MERVLLKRKMMWSKSYEAIIHHVRRNGLMNTDPYLECVSLAEIDAFETDNRTSVIVFGYDEKCGEVHPIRLAKAIYDDKVA